VNALANKNTCFVLNNLDIFFIVLNFDCNVIKSLIYHLN
jgi:hypothetical protein